MSERTPSASSKAPRVLRSRRRRRPAVHGAQLRFQQRPREQRHRGERARVLLPAALRAHGARHAARGPRRARGELRPRRRRELREPHVRAATLRRRRLERREHQARARARRARRVSRSRSATPSSSICPMRSFDVVINIEASHLYDDRARFFAEVLRVLKPGGHFCYTDGCWADDDCTRGPARRRVRAARAPRDHEQRAARVAQRQRAPHGVVRRDEESRPARGVQALGRRRRLSRLQPLRSRPDALLLAPAAQAG